MERNFILFYWSTLYAGLLIAKYLEKHPSGAESVWIIIKTLMIIGYATRLLFLLGVILCGKRHPARAFFPLFLCFASGWVGGAILGPSLYLMGDFGPPEVPPAPPLPTMGQEVQSFQDFQDFFNSQLENREQQKAYEEYCKERQGKWLRKFIFFIAVYSVLGFVAYNYKI
jgi:uncharacterized membrane protein SirB2